MKLTRKLFVLALALILSAAVFAGCAPAKADWEYISDKKTLIIGITIFKPMNYYDDNNKLIGFETEFAEAVCAKLGLEPKFQVIDWDLKESELKAKNIDVIWNGLTVTDLRKQDMDFSTSYIINKQVAIIQAANADKYKGTTQSMAGAKTAAEGKSAGETAIKADSVLKNNPYTAAGKQSDVLLEVKSGTVDVGVIDLVMANASIGAGTSYEDLMIVEGIALTQEEYAIGVRKNSPETLAKINAAMNELTADGTMARLAEKYGLSEQLALKP